MWAHQKKKKTFSNISSFLIRPYNLFMIWNEIKRKTGRSLTLTALLFTLGSCNSSGSTSDPVTETDALVVSGHVGFTRNAIRKLNHLHDRDINPADIDLSAFSLNCVTLQAVPTSAAGSLDASGNFSFSIPNAKGAKITCTLIQNTRSRTSGDDVVASLIVVDSNETDIDGNDKKESSVGLTDDTNFGDLNLDIESGELSVDKANIADTVSEDVATGDSFWDATGTWVISKLDSIPSGYSDICDAPPMAAKRSPECNGPRDGETVYFKQVSGKKWVWNDLEHTSGSVTDEDRYGMMIWSSQAGLESCSGGPGRASLGTTAEAIKNSGKLSSVDFSAATGIEFTEYAFATTITGTDTITDGYKSNEAVSQWKLNDCNNIEYQGENAWICRDSNATEGTEDDKFQINLSGGCIADQGTESTLDDEPIRIDDWQNITWDTPENPCSNMESPTHPGFNLNTCQGTYSSSKSRVGTHVTCRNEFSYSAIANPTSVDDLNLSLGFSFNWNNVRTFIDQGGPCSDPALDARPLEQARCYASFYEQNTREHEGDDSVCYRKIRANWSATTAEDFIRTSDEPMTRHAASFYELDSNGTGSIHSQEDDFSGVQVRDSWINCHTKRSFTVNIAPKTKVGDEITEAVGTFESENVLVDNDKEACVAFMKDQGAVKKSVQVGDTTYDLWAFRSKSMFKFSRAVK